MVYYGKKRSRLIESEEHTMGRKKREIAKTCLCYFLVCLISFLCIADMPCYKAKASEAIKSVHTSFYEKENIAISIKNEMLYFTKLPDRNSFSKIKVARKAMKKHCLVPCHTVIIYQECKMEPIIFSYII